MSLKDGRFSFPRDPDSLVDVLPLLELPFKFFRWQLPRFSIIAWNVYCHFICYLILMGFYFYFFSVLPRRVINFKVSDVTVVLIRSVVFQFTLSHLRNPCQQLAPSSSLWRVLEPEVNAATPVCIRSILVAVWECLVCQHWIYFGRGNLLISPAEKKWNEEKKMRRDDT